jgi:hypothetical protein
MSERLENHAERLKLARLLHEQPEALLYLSGVPADDLRELREQITEVLFGAHSDVLARLAAASRLLPIGLVATLGEKVFGPVLSARLAGRLDPERVVDMAAKLPVGFLADVAVEIDPRRSAELLARIPPVQVAAVSRELLSRREYVAVGRFVSYLPDESIRAAIGAFDPAAMLNVAYVIENKHRLPVLLGMLGPGQLEAMIALAEGSEHETEALELIAFLSPEQRAAIMRKPQLRRRLSA